MYGRCPLHVSGQRTLEAIPKHEMVIRLVWRIIRCSENLSAANFSNDVRCGSLVGLFRFRSGAGKSGSGYGKPERGRVGRWRGADTPLPRTRVKLYTEARYYDGLTNNTHQLRSDYIRYAVVTP